jgi:hypothetical protein
MAHIDIIFFGTIAVWIVYSTAIMTFASLFGLEQAENLLLIGEMSFIGILLSVLGAGKVSKRFNKWLKE